MNKLTAVILASCLCWSSVASVSSASTVDEKAVNAKCYVQLVGGGETISLWLVKPSLLKSLPSTISGQEILVISTQKKAHIYRAEECVLADDDFKIARARVMDKETPR